MNGRKQEDFSIHSTRSTRHASQDVKPDDVRYCPSSDLSADNPASLGHDPRDDDRDHEGDPASPPPALEDRRDAELLDELHAQFIEAQDIPALRKVLADANRLAAMWGAAASGNRIDLEAGELALRVAREVGELLASTPMNPGGRPPGNRSACETSLGSEADIPTLRELGISKQQAADLQLVASLPEPDFEEYIAGQVQRGLRPSVRGAAKLARRLQSRKPVAGVSFDAFGGATDVVSEVESLTAMDRRFGCIVIDTPRSPGHEGRQGRAQAISLADLPILDLLADCAHVHVRCSQAQLGDTVGQLGRWGLTCRGALVCPRKTASNSRFWANDLEYLVLGTRGRVAFDGSLPSALTDTAVESDGLRPGSVLEAIQASGPGPYLLLFAQTVHAGWTCWGPVLNGLLGPGSGEAEVEA